MRTRHLRFRGRSTLATLVMAAGLCVSGCAYQAFVRALYPPGAYMTSRIDAGTSMWGPVLNYRCLSGWKLQLHLLVGERRVYTNVHREFDPDERVSMVVLGNVALPSRGDGIGRMPWAEGDVLLVLEGGVEDAAAVVPCGSGMDRTQFAAALAAGDNVHATVIGLYSDPDKSESQVSSVRVAFVDQQGQVVPGADEFGPGNFGPFCYPNCPPESPLVTLPSRGPCLEAPNIDPCSIALNVGEGVRLRVETSDIVWLRIHETDPPDDDLPLVRLSIAQLGASPDGAKVKVRMRATLFPAGAGNESIPGWRPGASAAAVRPWRPLEPLDAPVYFDLLGWGAISVPGPAEGWLLVLESLDGSAEFEVTAERVAPRQVSPRGPLRQNPSL